MKKFVKYIILGISTLALCGCSKESINVDTFNDILKNNSCRSEDFSDDYLNDNNVNYMVNGYCEGFEIEFYVVEKEDYAKEVFNKTKEEFLADKTGTYSEKSINGSNFSTYKLNSIGEYKYIAYVDNTIMYIKADSSNKENIDAIIKKLGY